MAVNTGLRLNQTNLERQLKRLRGFNKFPEFAEELKRVVNRYAATDAHVVKIIDAVLDTRTPNGEGFVACPTPAEMATYCHETPEVLRPALVPADPNCSDCHGSGVVVRRGASPMTVGKTYEFACQCRTKGLPV